MKDEQHEHFDCAVFVIIKSTVVQTFNIARHTTILNHL